MENQEDKDLINPESLKKHLDDKAFPKDAAPILRVMNLSFVTTIGDKTKLQNRIHESKESTGDSPTRKSRY